MLMKVPISLEMWIQCGPSDIKCGCKVDPQHPQILNVDAMWEGLDGGEGGGVWYSLIFLKI